MSAIGSGQFFQGQAQSLLGQAAQDETRRNIANKNIEQANEDGKTQLGASSGALAGAAIGSVVPGVGTMAGAAIGAIGGGLLGRLF